MLIVDTRKDSGCDYHRVQLPLQHVTPAPKRPVLFVNRDTRYDVGYIQRLKRDGGLFVYDLDDAIELPPNHPLAKLYDSDKVRKRYADLLALADIVTVTTPRLAEYFRHKTKAPIEVLPNALPFDRGQFTKARPDQEITRPIVWAGGSSHEVDLRLVEGIIDGRQLALAGYQRIEPWFNMVRMFPGCLVKPAAPVRSYTQHYDGHRFAIAPLAASDFAACKSNLKILEAGAKGLPIVVSWTEPYNTDDMYDCGGVLAANDAIDWHEQTQRLLRDPMRCHDWGECLADHVRTHYHLDAVNEHRRQILES